jgi:hypothetical protein
MTPGVDRYVKLTGLAAAILAGAMISAVALYDSPREAVAAAGDTKGLKFSHANHVVERGIACADCHTKVAGSKMSSDRLIPVHEDCQTCHEEQINNDCAFCHTNPDDIQPMVLPVRDLAFSHENHVGARAVACETCHGGVLKDSTFSEIHYPAMASCMDCHGKGKPSNDCATCHSDFSKLIPNNHLVSNFTRVHDQPVSVGLAEVECATCHKESFCQECHTGDQLRSFGGMPGMMTAPGARTPLKDSPDALRLQAAHDLNYRYNHAIDAKSRASDCASCHEARSFCVECHRSEGLLNAGVVKPQSHFEAGWVTIGSGSGGGRHAETGRRDIESCVSCHDVEGKDPSCMLCHSGQ